MPHTGPNIGANCEPHHRAHQRTNGCTDKRTHARADDSTNARAHAAPVHRRFARLRQDGGWHLLRAGRQRVRVQLQARLLAERSPRSAAQRARVHACHGSADSGADGRADGCADYGAHGCTHDVAYRRADGHANREPNRRAHQRTHGCTH